MAACLLIAQAIKLNFPVSAVGALPVLEFEARKDAAQVGSLLSFHLRRSQAHITHICPGPAHAMLALVTAPHAANGSCPASRQAIAQLHSQGGLPKLTLQLLTWLNAAMSLAAAHWCHCAT